MGRRYWLALAALLVLAAGSGYIAWLLRDRPDAQQFAGPPRSDYTLADFTLNALDSEGRRSFQVSGPRLVRRGEDGSIHVTTPDYLLVDGSGKAWRGRSDAAWVNRDGSLMKLQGAVEMRRDAEPGEDPVDVETRDVTAWPREHRIATDAAATIRQPGSILRGTGMRGDLDARILELMSDVHSTLQPARTKR
ncbi:MAG TPA: LPS export ABC transporter periplasmic protein LptC [Dokdonella sp.]